jgi:hypothetical protein
VDFEAEPSRADRLGGRLRTRSGGSWETGKPVLNGLLIHAHLPEDRAVVGIAVSPTAIFESMPAPHPRASYAGDFPPLQRVFSRSPRVSARRSRPVASRVSLVTLDLAGSVGVRRLEEFLAILAEVSFHSTSQKPCRAAPSSAQVPRADFQPSSNLAAPRAHHRRRPQQVNLHAGIGHRVENRPCQAPHAISSVPPSTHPRPCRRDCAGGRRPLAIRLASSPAFFSLQRSNTAPVRKAPLIAVAGR